MKETHPEASPETPGEEPTRLPKKVPEETRVHTEASPETPVEERRPTRLPMEVSEATRTEIVRLKSHGYGSRKISQRVSLSRDVVRRVLREQEPRSEPQQGNEASKLEKFSTQILERVEKGLTTSRILREITALGYSGGRTILAEHVSALRVKVAPASKKAVKRRFETPPGEEMQTDWSPYTVDIAGRATLVFALGVLLCYSRKLFVVFFRSDRQSYLLEGLARAFAYFGGCALRLVLDNMSQATLGRLGPKRTPLWHPRFLEFTKHHGTEPYACRVRDPDRKGKKEKSFRLVEDDFLRGSSFASFDDLEHRTKLWLDETPDAGNLRVHGTTRRVPNEVWITEREVLIRLPEKRFAVYEDAVRIVDQDSTLSVHGTRYSVPSSLANQTVGVRLFAEHFEVLDPHGRIVSSRRFVADIDKGRLQIDPTHYATLPRRPTSSGGGERLDEAFSKRFPQLTPFVEGLKLRTKSLAHIHIRKLLRLVERNGEPAFIAAVLRAQQYRRFSVSAIERILEQSNPLPEPDPIAPLNGAGALALGEVIVDSLEGYATLDRDPADSTSVQSVTEVGPDEKGDSHGS